MDLNRVICFLCGISHVTTTSFGRNFQNSHRNITYYNRTAEQNSHGNLRSCNSPDNYCPPDILEELLSSCVADEVISFPDSFKDQVHPLIETQIQFIVPFANLVPSARALFEFLVWKKWRAYTDRRSVRTTCGYGLAKRKLHMRIAITVSH